MDKKKVGIIGASGYTGSELVRLLVHHPEVEITAITSESLAGKKFSDIHTSFQNIVDTRLIKAEEAVSLDLDLVFPSDKERNKNRRTHPLSKTIVFLFFDLIVS